ncbi:hypothetical protein R5R35_014431 [Gryllus longicercus]|uniref:DNA mismatch repair protein S5 domain-containing protein n=1 Tax=Gryllus longicercus TaxID=2509291 RepID=A0AAN9VV61_9ORTH
MANQIMQSSRSIKKLDPDVVSRIAAGEVVLRPANALKELIENSLDAGATSIKVEVKDGGMKYLQIVDNGCGIKKEDLDLVCERHATSKLESLDDLQSVSTYGFRGEALSSISLISNVSIVTKTAEERCGYKVSYCEGKMKDKPIPCAANQGTAITVENLFYNVPLRQKALKNLFEEHKRVQDVVGRYAVHNASVGFSLKKYGQNHLYINSMNNTSTKDVIGLIFDTNIARNLLEKEGSDDTLQFKYKILATSLIYSAKQMIFLLFINHRLVKSEGLQKEIAELYNIYLPPKSYPFVYISLEMPSANVDVNVHPRKETVFYLHEEYINKKILTAIQQLVLGKDAYQTYKQETLSFSQKELSQKNTSDLTTLEDRCTVAGEKTSVANNETDLNKDLAPAEETALMEVTPKDPDKSISDKSMKGVFSQSMSSERKQSTIKRKEKSAPTSPRNSLKKQFAVDQSPKANDENLLPPSENSVNSEFANLMFNQDIDFDMAEIIEDTNNTITSDHSLLGSVNSCETEESKEYFYQVIVNGLGNLDLLKFSEPVPLSELLQNADSDWTCSLEAAQMQLMKNAEILDEFFNIKIDENGNLLSLPWLLEGYFPPKNHLPEFIKQLACDVTWDEDNNCVDDICLLIASYHSKFPTDECPFFSLREWNNVVEFTIFPAVKKNLWPSKELYLKSICEVHAEILV